VIWRCAGLVDLWVRNPHVLLPRISPCIIILNTDLDTRHPSKLAQFGSKKGAPLAIAEPWMTRRNSPSRENGWTTGMQDYLNLPPRRARCWPVTILRRFAVWKKVLCVDSAFSMAYHVPRLFVSQQHELGWPMLWEVRARAVRFDRTLCWRNATERKVE